MDKKGPSEKNVEAKEGRNTLKKGGTRKRKRDENYRQKKRGEERSWPVGLLEKDPP